MEPRHLITYSEALELTGLSERTFFRRLASENIPVHMDGRDRRRRLIDRADVERLIKVELVERGSEAA